jgi:DNA-binding NtrC family response regulator
MGERYQIQRNDEDSIIALPEEQKVTNSDRGILYAVSDSEGTARRFDAFGVIAQLGGSKRGPEASPISALFEPALSYGQTRAAFESDFEIRYVSWLLTRHHGNISAAAREARMDRKHLHDLAKKHGLRGPGMIGRR